MTAAGQPPPRAASSASQKLPASPGTPRPAPWQHLLPAGPQAAMSTPQGQLTAWGLAIPLPAATAG